LVLKLSPADEPSTAIRRGSVAANTARHAVVDRQHPVVAAGGHEHGFFSLPDSPGPKTQPPSWIWNTNWFLCASGISLGVKMKALTLPTVLGSMETPKDVSRFG
jgi:hypothetical protein